MKKFPAWAWVAMLMLLALAVRVPVALSRGAIGGDETVYAHMAEQIARGNGLLDMLGEPSTIFLPLFPVLTAGVSFLLGDYIVSGYVVEVLFGCLLLIPAFLLGRELAGERVGIFTAALVAVLPLTVEMSTRLYTENVYAFFMLLGAYLGWRMLKGGSGWYAAAAGASLGLGYLTNPAGTFYLVAFLILLAVIAVRGRSWKAPARAAVLFVVPFALLAAPYVVYLHGELGQWTYTGKKNNDAIIGSIKNISTFSAEYEQEVQSLTEDGTGFVGTEKYEESADPVTFFLSNPATGARIFAKSYEGFYREELFKVIPLWLLPLLGLGLFAKGWDRARSSAVGYTALLSVPLLLILAIEYRSRFSMPYVPLAMIWVAAGWRRLEEWGRETLDFSFSEGTVGRLKRWVPPVMALAVMAPLLMMTGIDAARESYRTEFRAAGEWIKDNAGEDRLVMDREYTAAYYSGGTMVLIPYADYRRFTEYARYRGVDYLVIQRRAIPEYRPDLAVLLEEDEAHPEWRLVHTEREGTSGETLVFELNK